MNLIILCGGAGTRLWPLSRKSLPKQFCDLLGDGVSLFERTILRNLPLVDRIIVVTNQEYFPIAKKQLAARVPKGMNVEYILESEGRNTAPAIAFAALEMGRDEEMLVVPSDHLINDEDAYRAAVGKAKQAAVDGYLCTFGLKPDYAETGYGYIEEGAPVAGKSYHRIGQFAEKPDAATAEKYVKSGRYTWNSGMFVFQAGLYLEELAHLAPSIYEAVKNTYADSSFSSTPEEKIVHLNANLTKSIPSQSIDYAIMEKSKTTAVVSCSIGWSDLGSWDAVYDIRGCGDNEDGEKECLLVSSRHNLVIANGRKVVLVGMEDCIVVDTADALLVMKRGAGQAVKKVVDGLKNGSADDRALLE